jgi:hypothetical protein
MLGTALTQERADQLSGSEDLWDAAVSAQGLLDAARILAQRYHLVITNVPYLGQGKQSEKLRGILSQEYPDSKFDLATVFMERMRGLTISNGAYLVVAPQNWLFLNGFRKFREKLLSVQSWNYVAVLGARAFSSISGEVVQVALSCITNSQETKEHAFFSIDTGEAENAESKSKSLIDAELLWVKQSEQLANPDARVIVSDRAEHPLLIKYPSSFEGIGCGDLVRFSRKLWETDIFHDDWVPFRGTTDASNVNGGVDSILFWQQGEGDIYRLAIELKDRLKNTWRRGSQAWEKNGVAINRMGDYYTETYKGEIFDSNIAAVVPNQESLLPAMLCYMSSDSFRHEVRKIDKSLKITNVTFLKVPFDLVHWQQVAAERYPNGLPKPYSDDPIQWIFHGHPKPATDPLQVAIARLLGYSWPAETDADMELSDEARAWIAESAKLASLADDDGIACIPPVRGEKPAAERLLDLLIAAWGADWQQGTLDKLLAQADCAGKSLDFWLRERFFEQHCKRFQHRPFIWHVWDGIKDGFAALVNYHKLDRKNLETLIYTYLGDWIRTQERGSRDGVDGADLRLTAAQALKTKLEKILEGEAPYDIFVRWKPLDQQPIGWEPDLNDGVRLNIRPFMTAEVLRHNKKPKLNIAWDKDRGKDVESAPWFKVFKGDRINDHHLTLADKLAARSKK